MDQLEQQAREALLTSIANAALSTTSSAYLRNLAEAYQRVTGAPEPTTPPAPIGADQ